MIREAILANMHRAIDEGDYDQFAWAKKLLDEIGDPKFKDYHRISGHYQHPSSFKRLTPTELRLRSAIISAAPEVATYAYLKQTVWPGINEDELTNRLYVTAHRLRNKIQPSEILVRIKDGYKIEPLS